jgi:hypothetical protein
MHTIATNPAVRSVTLSAEDVQAIKYRIDALAGAFYKLERIKRILPLATSPEDRDLMEVLDDELKNISDLGLWLTAAANEGKIHEILGLPTDPGDAAPFKAYPSALARYIVRQEETA